MAHAEDLRARRRACPWHKGLGVEAAGEPPKSWPIQVTPRPPLRPVRALPTTAAAVKELEAQLASKEVNAGVAFLFPNICFDLFY